MGTDMEAYLEIKTPYGWKYAGTSGYQYIKTGTTGEIDISQYPDNFSVTRDYVLFYILTGYHADLGYGMGAPNIYSPRGLPEDCSEEISKIYDYFIKNEYGMVDTSYVTLQELIDISTQEPFNLEGYISQDTSTLQNMETSIHHITKYGVNNYTPWAISKEIYDRRKNTEDYKLYKFQSKCITAFIDEIKSELENIFYTDLFDNGINLSPANVRVVFWFDQ